MKRSQHYLPRFILKKFIDLKSKSFKVFDIKTNTYLSGPKYPPKTMTKALFYEHDSLKPNEIEDLLASRESIYAPIIDKILLRQSISKDEFAHLLEFRHVTYYRSNEFVAFHSFQTSRGENSWRQRWEWRSFNGSYETTFDVKKSQVNAIKRTINGTEPILQLSLLTPVCIALQSSSKKFIIGDSGSLSMGDELKGVVIIVISPYVALLFPRPSAAVEMMKERHLKLSNPLLMYEDCDDELVETINKATRHQAFAHWVESY